MDTHFNFLKYLKIGDFLNLQSHIKTESYRVTDIVVIDKTTIDVVPTDINNKLLLITCYPFNAVQDGGPLRYVVIAEPNHKHIFI